MKLSLDSISACRVAGMYSMLDLMVLLAVASGEDLCTLEIVEAVGSGLTYEGIRLSLDRVERLGLLVSKLGPGRLAPAKRGGTAMHRAPFNRRWRITQKGAELLSSLAN